MVKNDKTVSNPGDLLKQERLAQNLTLDDVSTKLYLTSRVVKKLEQGEFDQVHGDVFVRGYLRSYAKLLGLNDEDIISKYVEFIAPQMPQDDAVLDKASIKKSSSSKNYAFFMIIVLVLLAALSWLFSSQNDDIEVTVSENVASSDVIADDTQTEIHSTNDNVIVEEEPVTVEVVADEPEPKQETESIVIPNLLKIEFTDECWVKVVDATGKVMVDGIYKKDSFIEINGKLPLAVNLGNAKGAKVSFADEPVSIKVRSSGSASFSVGN